MKSIKKLSSKSIKNTKSVKGGALGRGSRTTASHGSTRTELL